jgi:DNA-directed RNA polymerase specialized sigma24 family protein
MWPVEMMTEDEYRDRMDRIALARQERDDAIHAAQEQFTDEVIAAYEGGLTLYDIQHATGVSITTIRTRMKERGVQARR